MTDHEHEDECECTDEYGPCETHSETIITREGASTRTADELVAVFLSDVTDLYTSAGREAPTGEHYLTGADYWQAVEDERARERERVEREGGYAYVSGWAPVAGTLTREDGTVITWEEGEMSQWLSDAIIAGESDLADLGLEITWGDGYRIYRTTGGPFHEDEDEAGTEDEVPAPVPVEPTYLRNECLTCGAPMLGVHYHEADEDEDEDEDGGTADE